MPGSRSFKEYVSKRYDNDIFNSIASYLYRNKDKLPVQFYNVNNIDRIELQSIDVKHVPVNDLPGSRIGFDIYVEAYFTVMEYNNRRGEREEDATMWFKFTCEGDLQKNLDDVVVRNPEEYISKSYHEKPLDDSLVPYISSDQYDSVAEEFLKAAGYGASLTVPTHIEPMKIAEAFGLTVKQGRLSEDHSVFGRLYFCDDEVELWDETDTPSKVPVKGGTIYVDPLANFLKNYGKQDNTIIHECFHWYKHRKAYELERLYNEHATSIGCLVVGGVQGSSKKSTEWMERQANAITPRIQMPMLGFKKFVSDQMHKYKAQGLDYIDALEPVIREISVFYNVSLTAAKIRLIDAGYHDAAGALNYVDGAYVRAHSWKKNAIEKNQTFTINEVDAAIQSMTYLRNEVESGKYEYVESHFVFHSPKYITTDSNGDRILTEYARRHMDECAIVFDLSLRNPEVYGESYHTECYLNKDEHSPFEFEYTYKGEKPLTPEEEEKELEKFLLEAERIAASFNNDFSFCMKESKKLIGKSYNTIADEVGIDERQVRRVFDGESGSLETIVAIIFAMEVPPQISGPLMERSPHRLMNSDAHNWIKVAFQTKWGAGLKEARAYLARHDVKI